MNTSAPFNPYEYNYQWKTSRHYHDFTPGNDWLNECEYPRFWDDLGRGITETTLVKGCRDSEFDQVHNTESLSNGAVVLIKIVWRNRIIWHLY
jgi:alpha-1,3-glucan synthase